MASTSVGMRWMRADENFRFQIDTLMAKMRTRSKRRIAEEAGIVDSTFYKRYKTPGELTKKEERQLASVFERYGLKYDPTWGERATA